MNIEDKRVLVIGDICLDRFIQCEFTRICREAPVPILNKLNVVENFGMAGNVSSNLLSLGVHHDLITTDKNEKISIKSRYVDKKSGHMYFRIDEDITLSDEFDIDTVDISKYNGVIISDYCLGFLNEDIIREICDRHPVTFLDTKRKIGKWANPTFYKINESEWINSDRYENDNVIVTLGENGCRYRGKIYKTPKIQEFDVSGAGDTFIATFAAAYTEQTHNIEICLEAAMIASSNVVSKRGVSVPDYKLKDILDSIYRSY
jgi:bifunctional ADP-heptose synthase (sugar kinase/adenylyltransferase)